VKFEKVTSNNLTFKKYLDEWVKEDTSDKEGGINAILKKLSIAHDWHKEKWGLELYQLRREVRERQEKVNDFVRDNVTIYDYQ
jgi:hypothetical protein